MADPTANVIPRVFAPPHAPDSPRRDPQVIDSYEIVSRIRSYMEAMEDMEADQ